MDLAGLFRELSRLRVGYFPQFFSRYGETILSEEEEPEAAAVDEDRAVCAHDPAPESQGGQVGVFAKPDLTALLRSAAAQGVEEVELTELVAADVDPLKAAGKQPADLCGLPGACS